MFPGTTVTSELEGNPNAIVDITALISRWRNERMIQRHSRASFPGALAPNAQNFRRRIRDDTNMYAKS